MGCIVSRQQFSENVAERAAEEWRHFSDTEEGECSRRARTINGRGGTNWTANFSTLALSASMSLAAGVSSQAQQVNMSFFMTSAGVPFSSSRRRAGTHVLHGHWPSPVWQDFCDFSEWVCCRLVNRLSGLSINAGVARMNVWRLAVRGNRRKLVSAAV
jgi:hypothetical protein